MNAIFYIIGLLGIAYFFYKAFTEKDTTKDLMLDAMLMFINNDIHEQMTIKVNNVWITVYKLQSMKEMYRITIPQWQYEQIHTRQSTIEYLQNVAENNHFIYDIEYS